ncbi:glutamate--tRNA ligase [Candidatus Woesearchaeota archaeon]|nr:glutamate--tRNA ligase [Candidatus Woesearchaeota archaeon]
MKDIVLKYVLKNAFDFRGKANSKVVLGAVLRENSALKSDVPALLKEIEKTIKDVEKMTLAEVEMKLGKINPTLLMEQKEEKMEGPLKELLNAVMGKVVVRIAPSPSGPLHIGHAYGTSLNYEYAKMYKGKLILRIEDTNAENIYPQAYELIERDVKWMTEEGVVQVFVQSSRLGEYYDAAEKLVNKGNAYVCECDADEWREKKNKGIACSCRELSVKENQLRYAKMFNAYAEGEAVLRLKTDIKDKNPAMRDLAIMRIVEHVHPKTGKEHRVWPLMIFSVAVDDHEMGVTHVLNGKDHVDNGEKERMIMKMLGWETPEYKHWGRINFEGFELSTSKIRLAIERKEYEGWEDIRLPFMPALRRRGYQAGAFRRFAIETGLSLNDKTVGIEEFWKMLNAFNKELIDLKANRYFFVDNPVKIKIEKGLSKEISLDCHPEDPKRGKRKFKAKGEVYVTAQDYECLDVKKLHRLMDYCNFVIEKGKWKFVSERYEEYKDSDKRGSIIHWVPVGEEVKVEVLNLDNKLVKGFGEKDLSKAKVGDIVQLERRYFARVDEKTKDVIRLWYLHS